MERSCSHSIRGSNRQSELACLDAKSEMRIDNTLKNGKYCSAAKVAMQKYIVMYRQAAHLYFISCSRIIAGRCYKI